MASDIYRRLTKILKDNGFYKIGNAKGSHEKWQHPDQTYTLTIPSNTKSHHTANDILKQAGIAKKL